MKRIAIIAILLLTLGAQTAMADVAGVLHTSQEGNVLENTFLRSDGIGSFSTMGGTQTRHSFRVKKRKNKKFWAKFENLNLEEYLHDSSAAEGKMEAKTNHLLMISRVAEDGTDKNTSYVIPKDNVPEDIQKWIDRLLAFGRK